MQGGGWVCCHCADVIGCALRDARVCKHQEGFVHVLVHVQSRECWSTECVALCDS